MKNKKTKSELYEKYKRWKLKNKGVEPPEHGVNGYVSYGCRCTICKAANAKRQYAFNEKRKKLKKPKHGSRSTYINWGCRCPSCRKAHTNACREYYHRRKEKNISSVIHTTS